MEYSVEFISEGFKKRHQKSCMDHHPCSFFSGLEPWLIDL